MSCLPLTHMRVLSALLALAGGLGCDGDPPQDAPSAPRRVAAPMSSPVAEIPRTVARLEGVVGEVSLVRGEQRLRAGVGDLHLRDVVETGGDSRAVVRFADGRSVELGAEARLVLTEDKSGLVIEVPKGLVLSRVPADTLPTRDGPGVGPAIPRVALRILTPFGLTRVGGETGEVSVDVKSESARVDVRLGEVEFISRSGESTQAQAGDALDVSAAKVTRAEKKSFVLEPIIVTLVMNGGKADLLKAGTARWRPLGKAGTPLEAGDAVRANDGQPRLALAGSATVLSLQRGTEILFSKSVRQGDLEESSLEVKRGGLNLELAARRKSRVVVGGLALQSDGGGHFGVLRGQDGALEVKAFTGDVTVHQGDATKTVRAGQFARIRDEGTDVFEEERAELVLPARSNLRLYHPGVERVTLTWDGEPGDYEVEVASDGAFTQTLVRGRVHQPRVVVPLPREGTLFWRATLPEGQTDVGRGSVHVEREPASKELARPRNEVREGDGKTTIFYQDKDKPPAVTLLWNPDSKAAKYQLAVYRSDSLARPVAERSASQPSLPLEAGILGEGNYVWSVTPVSSSGEALRGGKMNKLELVYDNSVPTLVITSPRNGEGLAGGKVHAVGVAPVGSRLSINGRAVPLDAKSRFDTTVTATGRSPMVIFRLSRPQATDAYTVRLLKRSK